MTGHTGFKGSWLVHWLASMGAEVHGIGLEPPSDPSLFVDARIADLVASDHRADLTDPSAVRSVVRATLPSVVLHLAAQPLVRDSYREPARTVAVNVTGTANLLDAVASLDAAARPEAVVVVTSDKVYAPRDDHPHREGDPLAGEDPYSASKAMCEGVVDLFRRLPQLDGREAWRVPLATARAGNVIGGGDWARERLVPDCIRAFRSGLTVELRYPDAVRPWQHVLEPLSGYLILAEHLLGGADDVPSVNFGPSLTGEASVAEVADMTATLWGGGASVRAVDGSTAPENPALRLDVSLAEERLGWRPRWSLEEAVRHTVDWYRCWDRSADVGALMDEQIAVFTAVRSAGSASAAEPTEDLHA